MAFKLSEQHEDRMWDDFVTSVPQGHVFQLMGWRNVIARAYGHQSYNIVGISEAGDGQRKSNTRAECPELCGQGSQIIGILPLVYMHHWLLGSSLISVPYVDGGGVLAEASETSRSLLRYATLVAERLGASAIEVRQYCALPVLETADCERSSTSSGWRALEWLKGWGVTQCLGRRKVRMVMELSDDPDRLMRSFKAKLRSQIRKPIKDGLTVAIGAEELLDVFYYVFACNMRDLGSPVHSKHFLKEVLRSFPERARIFVVMRYGVPLASGLTLGCNKVLSNPWASSLRRYRQYAPNMLLYWGMLRYACEQGYERFDFGRSTVGEGTHRFKEQWGARPEWLHWYRLSRDAPGLRDAGLGRKGRSWAIELWKKLPVPVTRALGPHIRRYISL